MTLSLTLNRRVRVISVVWLGLLFIAIAWPITMFIVWLIAAASRLTGYRWRKNVLLSGLFLTTIGAALMSTRIAQQVRIDSASSCATHGDASVMDSHTHIIRGPGGIRAIVRSEVCAYGLAQGGVVRYVFIAPRNNLNRRSLLLRYTSNYPDYRMANPPQVRWTSNKLDVVVPKGSIYALTYRQNRVANIEIHYNMHPEEDDSFVTGQIWRAAVGATIVDVLL
ncbi:MAG: hypothetical protein ABR508_05125 [Candidatus Baltobacteraceae bacterium]